jgi:hypothetical protein
MKKKYLIIIFILISSFTYSQKFISGKSKAMKIKLRTEYIQGIPPNLYVNMSFEDANKNGILEAKESADLKLTITNKGKGPAQGLIIKVLDNIVDTALQIRDNIKIPYIFPDQKIDITVPIFADREINTAEHKLEISVKEYFGYDMDPAYLVFNTYKLQKPQLVFSGMEITDIGAGTGAIIEDDQIQPGELVRVKLIVQNIGQNVSNNTSYVIETSNSNIYLKNNSGTLGDFAIGEVKEFWVSISPNKRINVKKELPIFLTLTNADNSGAIKEFQLPISLNQTPPKPKIVEVAADIESITKQFARFEYVSNKITVNISNIIDIKQVPPSVTKRTNAIAIVIGIEKYNYLAPAPYAANDAKIIKNYFKNVLGISKVYTYTNEEISGFFFDRKFNPNHGELKNAIVEGETELFVFYSGHGIPSKNGENVFLLPYDGRIEALETEGYNLNKFYNNLNVLGAKSITLFMDACFSGSSRTTTSHKIQSLIAMKGVSIKPKVVHPWESNPNFTIFSSSGFNETSLGFDLSKTGLFTYFLCAGLQGNADSNKDNKVTTGELAEYILHNVQKKSIAIFGQQTPQFNGDKNIVLSELLQIQD